MKVVDSLFYSLLSVWLCMMIVFSGDFTSLKTAILGIVLALTLVRVFYTGWPYSLHSTICLLIWLILAISSYIHGLMRGYEFSLSLFFYMIVTPAICFLLASSLNEKKLQVIHYTLVVSYILILVFSYIYIAYRLNLITLPVFLRDLNMFGGTKISDDYLEVRMTNQPSLIFLMPYFSVFLLFSKEKLFYTSLVFLGFVVVVFSGRRALQVLFFLGLAISSFCYFYDTKISFQKMMKVAILGLFFILLGYFSFELIGSLSGISNPFETFLKTILSSFDSKTGGGIQRHIQSIELLELFSKSPIFGSGLNSHATYIRNISEPWSYEWVYLAFLSQNGIVISIILLIFIFILLRSQVYVANRNKSLKVKTFFYGVFSSSLCFIIAGSSNPMVYFSWFWFLAFICLNIRFSFNMQKW